MSNQFDIKQYLIKDEPYYQAQRNELALYWAAYAERLPEKLPELFMALTK